MSCAKNATIVWQSMCAQDTVEPEMVTRRDVGQLVRELHDLTTSFDALVDQTSGARHTTNRGDPATEVSFPHTRSGPAEAPIAPPSFGSVSPKGEATNQTQETTM